MANENDQQHHHHQSSSHHHHNTSDLQTDCEKSDTTTMKAKTDTDNDSADQKEGREEAAYYDNNESEADHENMPPTASKGKLNDLVADLCINGHRPHQTQQTGGVGGVGGSGSNSGGYGDYTNTRPVGFAEGFSHQSSLDAGGSENSFSINSAASATTHNVVQPPTQNSSSFSFKHFLSSSSAPTAPSTTVTSLDPPLTNNNNNNNSTSTTSSVSSSAISTRSLQTSTGARPKVPQSNSVTSTSISSLVGGGGGLSANSSESSAATKMKRSPRFSSFDSQASLAEYAGSSTTADLPPGEASSGVSRSSDYRLYAADERDRFAEWNLPTNASTMTTNSSDYDRGQYVPRSYSNYEMPRPQTSPRRRVNVCAVNRDSRPTRLTLNTNPNPKMAAKLKLDLPLNQNNSSGASSSSNSGGVAPSRKKAISTRSSDFQASNPLPGGAAAAAAAALPDFVQDHWMDSWYANDMHVNSPPSSPIAAFADEMPGSSGDQASGGMHRSRNSDSNPLPGPAEGFPMGLPEQPSSTVGSKMLPDFLSDGPIIHSSQRLADIATGLPSNSVGSPEDSNMTSQLSRLRSDNDILQRELIETRAALNEQTLRANSLERQLLEQQRQYKSETEETSDTNKKRSTAAQNHVLKLKEQIQQLTAEVELLRREKELMREEGAVGGCSEANCDRSSYAAAAAAPAARGVEASGDIGKSASSSGGGGGCVGVSSSTNSAGGAGVAAGIGLRPSRAQQISRDLRRAASNAEQNLRQLLAGVDNLRLMASNIEKSDPHGGDYDVSPDLFSDFLDDCDEYDEYPGGPAL